MKSLKKVLSGFCAFTMVAASLVSLATVASAEYDKPTAVPVVTVDEEAKTADIEIHVKGVPATVSGSTQYVTYAVVGVDVSSFSTVKLSNDMLEDDYFDWEDAHYTNPNNFGSTATSLSQDAREAYNGYFSYQLQFNTGTLAYNAKTTVTDDILLFKIVDLPLTDDALTNGFTVKLRGAEDTIGFAINTAKRGTDPASAEYMVNTGGSTAAVESATWTPSAPPTPSVVWEDATPYGDYVGERTIAAAYTVELTGTGEEDTYDAVTWKVTVGDDSRGHVTEGLSLGGTGKFKLGLAVGGVTTSNATVQAALGDQTPSQQ